MNINTNVWAKTTSYLASTCTCAHLSHLSVEPFFIIYMYIECNDREHRAVCKNVQSGQVYFACNKAEHPIAQPQRKENVLGYSAEYGAGHLA